MLFIVSVKMKALTYRYSYDRVKRKSQECIKIEIDLHTDFIIFRFLFSKSH